MLITFLLTISIKDDIHIQKEQKKKKKYFKKHSLIRF